MVTLLELREKKMVAGIKQKMKALLAHDRPVYGTHPYMVQQAAIDFEEEEKAEAALRRR